MKHVRFLIIVYAILAIISIELYPGAYFDIKINLYYNQVLTLLMILVGNLFLFATASRFGFCNKVLTCIGRNTLVIYILHGHIVSFLNLVLNRFKFTNSGWGIDMAKTTFAIGACCIISSFINRYIPELSGKSRIHNKKGNG